MLTLTSTTSENVVLNALYQQVYQCQTKTIFSKVLNFAQVVNFSLVQNN